MRIPGRWRAQRLKMKWDVRRGGTGMVLMYHRVADHPGDPELLCVSPRHFEEHLDVLCTEHSPTRLIDLAQGVKRGRIDPGSVALTFDDGYADNWHAAVPLLRRQGVPATVFVVSGQVGKRKKFWWDELGEILLGIQDLPSELSLDIAGTKKVWAVPPGIDGKGQDHPRYPLYQRVANCVKPLPWEERESALRHIAAWASFSRQYADQNRAVTHEELRFMASEELLDVGAHTVTHSALGPLPEAAQRSEIHSSKEELESIIGTKIETFSYPFGSRYDYTQKTVDLVRDEGFACACTTQPTLVWRRTDPFQIPRLTVRDWDGDTFARKLLEWRTEFAERYSRT